MNDNLPTPRLHGMVRLLVEETKRCAQSDAELDERFEKEQEAIRREYRDREAQIQEWFSKAQARAVDKYQKRVQSITRQFEQSHDECSNRMADKLSQVQANYDESRQKIDTVVEEERWTIEAINEADRRVARENISESKRWVNVTMQHLRDRYEGMAGLMVLWGMPPLPLPEDTSSVQLGGLSYSDALKKRQEIVDQCWERMQQLVAPRFLKGHRLALICAVVWAILLLPGLWMAEWYYWVAASLIGVICIGLLARYVLQTTLQARTMDLYRKTQQAITDAERLQHLCLQEANVNYQAAIKDAKTRRERSLKRINRRYHRRLRLLTNRCQRELQTVKDRYEPRLTLLKKRRDDWLRIAEDRYQKAMAKYNARFERDMEQAAQWKIQRLNQCRQTYDANRHQLLEHWQDVTTEYRRTTAEIGQLCQEAFPPWQEVLKRKVQPNELIPGAVPFGSLLVDLQAMGVALPKAEPLRALIPPAAPIPALLGFPTRGSLLLKANGDGRQAGIQVLRSVMLRYLTSMPPGQVRFTIFDPVGLGENFAAFTHLADHDEKLITGRIWTEPAHFEKRLADLSEHVENVIQKYLRNQFATLEEYNAQAGEMAEPVRVLVIAHFPVNFTEEAARRLLSIIHGGTRCGIHTLILVDEKQSLPRNCELADVQQNSTVLVWKGDRFIWQDPIFKMMPLTLEEPPDEKTCTALVHHIGQLAESASRVEVPFERLVPAVENWWQGDSREGISVPLGRMGAMRNQFLRLGEGTSQHVLIAGKTGSGKSTLLHTLIVQLALHYSPDEVELYLIDFKKGVEFKSYAAQELPHGRVIAIESEREFGLSVLHRLDEELQRRGRLFREAGVNDLPAYRQSVAGPMPRIVLVVDEFHEFFVEDDRIAQEAALVLDRLVRQGRAFGIHILLGSQTLGGAYSLARSTMDQMAVRIALQCSETDGHLILSKDNAAARLLSRPGEAIYNDANGFVEGNSLFQVGWLPEHQRDDYLQQLHALARERDTLNGRLRIVFEGNALARLGKEFPLQFTEKTGAQESGQSSYTAILGDPIAIKARTAAVFTPRNGCNLLLVGQHAEAAASVLTVALTSLAGNISSLDPVEAEAARFCIVVDGKQDARALQCFEQLAEAAPFPVQCLGRRKLAEMLQQFTEELARRRETDDASLPPVFLCIHGLQHFRDLRRKEDDFGFSRGGDGTPQSPAQQFQEILREGPAFGIFALVWCDTLANLQRAIDRQGLREFEMRVLFQMNANDSSMLIDSPLASRLGLYRALYYSEQVGALEKFRPYELPDAEWFAWVKEQWMRQSLPAGG